MITRPVGQAGQVLPLAALCFTVLMGFSGLVLDVGSWEYQQRQQQNATDAAAVAGAQQLVDSSCPNKSAAQTGAYNDSALNGFANGVGNVTVTVQNPPTTGPYAGNDCAVYVQITRTNVQSFFTRVLGYGNGVSESTQAVAQVFTNGGYCNYLLSKNTPSIFNGFTVNSPACGWAINDTATFNGGSFTAPYIGYAGGTPVENGVTFPKASPQPMLAIADPCPQFPSCEYITQNPPAATACTSPTYSGEATVNLTPGCFDNITINGVTTLNFAPGTYVFNGSTIINGLGNVSGSGVTLYVTASGTPPIFNGVSNLSLSPPSSGNYAGVLYYEVPSSTSSPIFNGNTSNDFSGLIYAPGATDAIINGTGGTYLVLVLGAATFNGSTTLEQASPPPNGLRTHTVALGE
jgi:Flp pilus assembly protein TadG